MTDWWKSIKPGDPIMTFDGEGQFIKAVEGLVQFDLENGEVPLSPQIRYIVKLSGQQKQCSVDHCRPL